MEIPSLPTDNLYKFTALSGLFIIILSTVYYNYKLDEIENSIKETELKSAKLSVSLEFLKMKGDRLLTQMKNVEKNFDKINEGYDIELRKLRKIRNELYKNSTNQTNPSFDIYSALWDKEYREVLKFYFDYRDLFEPYNVRFKENSQENKNLIEKSFEYFDVSEKYQLAETENTKNQLFLDKKKKEFKRFSIIYKWTLIIGFIFLIFGIYKWYNVLQKPLDKKLLYEMKVAEKNFKEINENKINEPNYSI